MNKLEKMLNEEAIEIAELLSENCAEREAHKNLLKDTKATIEVIIDVMANNMPIEYLDTQIRKLSELICEMNQFRLDKNVYIGIKCVFTYHRRILRKIMIEILNCIEN